MDLSSITSHLLHPWTVSGNQTQELSKREKILSVVVLVVGSLLTGPLGVAGFYALTSYFKTKKVTTLESHDPEAEKTHRVAAPIQPASAKIDSVDKKNSENRVSEPTKLDPIQTVAAEKEILLNRGFIECPSGILPPFFCTYSDIVSIMPPTMDLAKPPRYTSGKPRPKLQHSPPQMDSTHRAMTQSQKISAFAGYLDKNQREVNNLFNEAKKLYDPTKVLTLDTEEIRRIRSALLRIKGSMPMQSCEDEVNILRSLGYDAQASLNEIMACYTSVHEASEYLDQLCQWRDMKTESLTPVDKATKRQKLADVEKIVSKPIGNQIEVTLSLLTAERVVFSVRARDGTWTPITLYTELEPKYNRYNVITFLEPGKTYRMDITTATRVKEDDQVISRNGPSRTVLIDT